MTEPASTERSLALPEAKLVGLPERFQPRNLTELMAWGKLVVSSGCAPKGMNEAGVVIAVQMGAELGITPTQALQNIAVINGRPSIWGDLGLALFKRDAKYKSFEERPPDKALESKAGWCKIEMKDGSVIERTFSIPDAEKAKLWSKEGPWQTYPGRMLQMRARWWAMRDAAPEVFKGLASKEEQEDQLKEPEYRVHGEEPRMPRSTAEPSPGVDPAAVERFARDVKPASGVGSGGGSGGGSSAPVIDRSKLQKVVVKGSRQVKNFYAITVETSSGGELEMTTFDPNHHAAAEKLRGNFALIATKQNGKYTNLVHIEAAVEDPPPPAEPGSNG